MKNCNCKDKEVTPCNDKCVIRQMIDECSGNKINYITLASAVLMGCNDTETVEDVLNEIQRKLNQIDNHIDEYTWDAIIAFLKNNLTRLEPELTNLINSRIENYFLHNDFAGLKQLFRQLFAEWETTFTNLINRIGQGISREELDSILNTRLAPYYTKTEIDTLLSNLGGVKGVAINGASHEPNDNGLVNLGTGFLKSENLDSTPTSGSSNPVTSNGIYNALANKQDKINDLATIRNNAANAVKDVKFEATNISLKDTNNIVNLPLYGISSGWFIGKDRVKESDFYIKGQDINGDGIWDIADVNALLNIMLGYKQPSDYPGNADLSGDGKYDVSDLSRIVDIMLGKSGSGPYIAATTSDFQEGTTFVPMLGHVYMNNNLKDLFQVSKIVGNSFYITYLNLGSSAKNNTNTGTYEMSLLARKYEDSNNIDIDSVFGSRDQWIRLITINGKDEITGVLQVLNDESKISGNVSITFENVHRESNGAIVGELQYDDVTYTFIWTADAKNPIITAIPVKLNGNYTDLQLEIGQYNLINDILIKLPNYNLAERLEIKQNDKYLTSDNNNNVTVPDLGTVDLTLTLKQNCIIINNESIAKCQDRS